MSSWRDTTSQAAQDDFDRLLNAVLPFAEQTLARYGEMFPFGAAIDDEGAAAIFNADPGLGTHPPSQQVLDALYELARADAASHRAFVFVADVLADGADAIRMEMEHQQGAALSITVPYTRARFTKKVSTGQMRVSVGPVRIWTR